jgi:hypothetical protein
VVAYAFVEKNHGHIGWKRWIGTAIVPTLVTMVLATGMVMWKSYVGWY